MKLLYREDVLEAGHDLPSIGLCENIGEKEMEALKFGGEWVLAKDEVLVADGHEQRFLYMIVNGQVGIYKADDQGRNQQIATLATGAAFGEMAFLSGGVASATVQALGECVLWRMDHERLLEFISEHGFAGGQLCLNVASILSGRLVEGNRKVLDMGRELQDSLMHLQSATAVDQQKSEALKQMQSKVSNMQNAFKGSAVKKSGLSPLAIVAFALAGISTLGMIGLFLSIDDSVAVRADSLAQKVEKLEKNESFYLDLKKRLEGENEEMVGQTNTLRKEKESLQRDVDSAESKIDDLRDTVRSLEKELSNAKDDLVRQQKAQVVKEVPEDSGAPKVSAEFKQNLLKWAQQNSTVAFPAEVVLLNDPVSLTDKSQQVKVPIAVGGALRAMRFHPQSNAHLIVAQLHSDKLLALSKIDNTNLYEALAPKFVKFMHSRGQVIKNPYEVKKKLTEPAPVSSAPRSSGSSRSLKEATTPDPDPAPSPKVLRSKPLLPQKGEDFLRSTSPAKVEQLKNDHGTSCVCKECRANKVGKGSLFPE
jgi:CRP-like cAMP-binding protein